MIRVKVEEKLGSDEVKQEIERRVEEGHKKLFEDVEAQLEREKQAALTEARQKEVIIMFVYYIRGGKMAGRAVWVNHLKGVLKWVILVRMKKVGLGWVDPQQVLFI